MRSVPLWSQTLWASDIQPPLAPFFRIPCPFKKGPVPMTSSANLTALALLIMLGACDANSASKPASAVSIKRQPGSWTFDREIIAFDAAGLTGDMAEMAKAGKASVGTKDASGPACIEPATVSDDSLTKRLQEAIQFGPEWKVERSSLVDGKVDFKAAMRSNEQGDGEMTIVGTLSPVLSDLTLITASSRPGGGAGSIRTTMHTRNERIGDCTPGEDTMG